MKKNTIGDCHEVNDLGLQERILLLQIQGAQPRLNYPAEPLKMKNGCVVEKFIIPEEEKAEVLEKLYPFVDRPAMDEVLLDLHTNTTFRVEEFLVIREGDLNFLAAPKYAEAGGTVLDWVEPDTEDDSQTMRCGTLKGDGFEVRCLRTV